MKRPVSHWYVKGADAIPSVRCRLKNRRSVDFLRRKAQVLVAARNIGYGQHIPGSRLPPLTSAGGSATVGYLCLTRHPGAKFEVESIV